MLAVVSVLYRMQFSAHRALHDMRETRVLRYEDGIQLHARSGIAARELPEKTIVKNFASLVTYPHSERKRLENRSTPKQT
jgi:hypothetical protein